MVIAAEPVHSGDALVLNTVIHGPHVNAHASPFVAAAATTRSSEPTAEPRRHKTTTERLNPRRKFVHRDRPGIHVGDIAGARSRKLTSVLGPRNVDPLEPAYALPSCELRPATPPKFIKDSLSTDDIWGAQPMIPRHQLIATRNHIDYSDVPGTRSRSLLHTRSERAQLDSLDVFDINRGEYNTFRTSRVTCPLSPRYDIDSAHCSSLATDFRARMLAVRGARQRGGGGSAGKSATRELYGDVEFNHPLPRPEPRGKDLKLYTADIMGEHAMLPERRGGARDPNDVSDIQGAQASTVKFKPVTRRQTNPLQPAYRFLDYQKRERSVRSAPYSRSCVVRRPTGTFSFDHAPSAAIKPAEPAFAGTAMKRGVKTFGKVRARGGGGGGGLHMHHARGSLKAPNQRSKKQLPPMASSSDKLTSRSAPPFDKATLPAFHRQNSKLVAGGAHERCAPGQRPAAARSSGKHVSQYQQKVRAQQRAADAESVRALAP